MVPNNVRLFIYKLVCGWMYGMTSMRHAYSPILERGMYGPRDSLDWSAALAPAAGASPQGRSRR